MIEVSGDGSLGIATRYGMDGPGVDSRWRRDYPPGLFAGGKAAEAWR